jgi:hypothetical protein
MRSLRLDWHRPQMGSFVTDTDHHRWTQRPVEEGAACVAYVEGVDGGSCSLVRMRVASVSAYVSVGVTAGRSFESPNVLSSVAKYRCHLPLHMGLDM